MALHIQTGMSAEELKLSRGGGGGVKLGVGLGGGGHASKVEGS